MQRHLLGVISLLLLIAGGALLFGESGGGSQAQMAASICIRAGLVLGAIWLAFPQVTQLFANVSPLTLGCILAAGAIVIARPRAIVVVAPIVAAIALLQFFGWILKPPAKRRPTAAPQARKHRR